MTRLAVPTCDYSDISVYKMRVDSDSLLAILSLINECSAGQRHAISNEDSLSTYIFPLLPLSTIRK